jgi:hypothetical protein
MDLGLDRDQVLGALDAFAPARELVVDLGDVNGRPFVNNVSLGLYARIVRSPEYRAAKAETTLTLTGCGAPEHTSSRSPTTRTDGRCAPSSTVHASTPAGSG